MPKNVAFLLGAVLVLWMSFALRVVDLQHVPPGLHYDGARLLGRAWRLSAGYGIRPYFQDIAEPFDFMLRSAYHSVTGGVDVYMSQMVSVWLGLLAVAAVMAVARALYREHPQRTVIALVAGVALGAMPQFVVLGRHIYRANWLPPASMLALLFLLALWRTPRRLYAVLTGAFTGLATIFYTGGLLFPPAMAFIGGLLLLKRRLRWPGWRNLLLLTASFLVVMLPWFVLYLSIPNWLSRISDLGTGRSPLADPSLLLPNFLTALHIIVTPHASQDLRYGPFTTGFLNPALLILLVVGVLWSLWRGRRVTPLTPLVIVALMLWADALSSEPFQPVRLAGAFAALALLAGLGAGVVLHGMRTLSWSRWLGRGALLVLLIATPLHSAYHIGYHYYEQPLINDPLIPRSIAYKYRLGVIDFFEDIQAQATPAYVPLETLNTDLAVAVLRPRDYPVVRAYAGEELPAGRVLLPINELHYGFFLIDHTPIQYGLLLPETGEILILPPLSQQAAQQLYERAQADGAALRNAQGWVLGQQLPVAADEAPFADLRAYEPQSVLATYDDNLELVGIHAPQELQPGAVVPVTLYWRLRQDSAQDYFSRLQSWDAGGTSHGSEGSTTLVGESDFPLNILFYIYPSALWQAGEIVPETRWLRLADTLPAGGYRFALSVYDFPGPTPVTAVPTPGLAQQQGLWSLVGRSRVGGDEFLREELPAGATALNAAFGDFSALDGYEVAFDAASGSVELRLHWRVQQATAEGYIHFVHVLDANGELIAQQDQPPFGGLFPAWAWQPEMRLTTTHTLTLPAGAQAPYTLRTGWYRYPDLQHLPVTQQGAPQPQNALVITQIGEPLR